MTAAYLLGADSIGLPHIGRDAKCINKSRIPLDEETCELGVGGSIEAVEIAVAEVDVKITSLSGIADPRILLAGTDDGQILQVSYLRTSRGMHLPLGAFAESFWRNLAFFVA
ncbi:hypothetical protein COOONC_15587 [Cooperia oncophora]